VAPTIAPSSLPLAAAPAVEAPIRLQAAPMSFAPIAHRVDPSVVTVSTIEATEEVSPFFGTRVRENRAIGTGFIVDKDGVILTNNHVVAGADEITVTLSDERTFPAKVVGVDQRTDVAVIKIAAPPGLTPVPLGDSDAIDVGDWVVAIGNPFELSHTVSAGIISAKGRTRDDVQIDSSGYYNFLQTDAAINPGNSGGPLLNLKGEVVGMNSAIRGNANNIGFAIPINMIKQLLPMLLRDGHVTRSALGVQIDPVRKLPQEVRARFHVPDDRGLIVEGIVPHGAAENAGIAVGDVIVAFDGEAVDHAERLKWLASIAGVGRQVTLRLERGGKVFDQKVTLGLLSEPQRGDPAQDSPRYRR
jgi:serine protease Do